MFAVIVMADAKMAAGEAEDFVLFRAISPDERRACAAPA